MRGGECAYCFPGEFGNAEFAKGISTMLANPQSKTLFFVVNECDGVAHVVAYPRHAVYRACRDDMDLPDTGGGESAITEVTSDPTDAAPMDTQP